MLEISKIENATENKKRRLPEKTYFISTAEIYYISRASVGHIIKAAGAERVSNDAEVELGNILEKIADDISRDAIVLAVHAGRKTVKGRDIRLAASMYYWASEVIK